MGFDCFLEQEQYIYVDGVIHPRRNQSQSFYIQCAFCYPKSWQREALVKQRLPLRDYFLCPCKRSGAETLSVDNYKIN